MTGEPSSVEEGHADHRSRASPASARRTGPPCAKTQAITTPAKAETTSHPLLFRIAPSLFNARLSYSHWRGLATFPL
ncbi:hypothetical protein KCP70_21630 [Salmonella enterica subsp. enterica]|nr:hypothetical protein KCP70_21630 [Salmonella enterica subsp. enterica]